MCCFGRNMLLINVVYVVVNHIPFISLDSLDFSPQAKEVFNCVCDCKGITKTRFFHTLQALSEVNFVTD